MKHLRKNETSEIVSRVRNERKKIKMKKNVLPHRKFPLYHPTTKKVVTVIM